MSESKHTPGPWGDGYIVWVKHGETGDCEAIARFRTYHAAVAYVRGLPPCEGKWYYYIGGTD